MTARSPIPTPPRPARTQPILVDVLANDTDVDNGAVLTVTAASAPAGQGSASVVGNQVQFDPGTDFDDLADGRERRRSWSATRSRTSMAPPRRRPSRSPSPAPMTAPVANPDTATTSENASVS